MIFKLALDKGNEDIGMKTCMMSSEILIDIRVTFDKRGTKTSISKKLSIPDF